MRFACDVRGKSAVVAAAAVGWIGLLGIGGSAGAQSVYDGTLSSTDQAEVVAWSTLYWQRVDQGGGAPGTGFVFTNPAMNSPLFSPLRGVRATLEKVGSVSSDVCDQMAQPTTAAGTAEMIAVRETFRKAMLEGKIETDVYSNTSGTVTHANLILAAPASAGLTVYLNGGALVSIDLPLEKVSEVAYAAAVKQNISSGSQQAIAAMLGSGATWATGAGSVSESRKLITGEQSRADRFTEQVQGLLSLMEGAGNIPLNSTSVQQLVAQFGVYGELPFVAVSLSDAMVLLDPLTGNLSGPFEVRSRIDASGLLSVHPEAAGEQARYFTQAGCPIVIAAAWGPWDPAWGTPPTLTPSVPGTPGPPATPNVPAGGTPTYTCKDQALGGCSCWRTPTVVPALPAPRLVRELCTFSPAGCTPPGGCSGTVNPQYPSGDPPGPGSGCTMTCTLQYQ